jgi:hypothetical protein
LDLLEDEPALNGIGRCRRIARSSARRQGLAPVRPGAMALMCRKSRACLTGQGDPYNNHKWLPILGAPMRRSRWKWGMMSAGRALAPASGYRTNRMPRRGVLCLLSIVRSEPAQLQFRWFAK